MKIKNKAQSLRAVLPLAFAAAMLAAAPQVSAMPGLPGAAIQAADEDLEDKVRVALGATIGKPAQEIGVSARNGAVLLFGAVRSASLRERAERAARHVLGVQAVENALTVVRGT